jgi:hypothetical protein
MICQTIRGEEFQVDEEDYERFVKGHRFRLIRNGYVAYLTNKDGCANKLLHRIIMGVPPGEFIDHINRDRLDNRRENLRTATLNENQRNKGRYQSNTSGFKGVHWCKSKQKWVARVQIDNKRIHLGDYKHLTKAAMVAAIARIVAHGEFAAH